MTYRFNSPLITNDQSIDRVLAAGLPVALVFLNDSTPPALDQVMDQLADNHAGHLLVVKTDIKESPVAARRYQIQMPPAVVTVRDGQTVTKAEAIAPGDLENHIAYLLGQGPRPEVSQTATQPNRGPAQARPRLVTDLTFDRDVLQATEPVLVDFWAPWCGPCRMVEPALEKLASDLAGRLQVAKVNVDENPGVAARYGVQSIPMMMLVKGGRVIDRWAGALPETVLRGRVMSVL